MFAPLTRVAFFHQGFSCWGQGDYLYETHYGIIISQLEEKGSTSFGHTGPERKGQGRYLQFTVVLETDSSISPEMRKGLVITIQDSPRTTIRYIGSITLEEALTSKHEELRKAVTIDRVCN